MALPLRILITGRDVPLASRAVKATSFVSRLVGLLGRSALPDGEALIFEGCQSIHTIGMRFPIDVVFVDRRWTVVALHPDLGPGKLIAPVRGAWGVVEMAAGVVSRLELRVGDRLELVTT